MKQPVSAQTSKEPAMLSPNRLWKHKAVRAFPERDRDSTPPVHVHRGHDFSQTTVNPVMPMVGRDYGTTSCPKFPRTCPFGGACHTCPAQTKPNPSPASGKHGGMD
jgi:hypothetical protein